jgi:hypothetical protein
MKRVLTWIAAAIVAALLSMPYATLAWLLVRDLYYHGIELLETLAVTAALAGAAVYAQYLYTAWRTTK